MKRIVFIISLMILILPIVNAQQAVQPTEDPGVTPDSFLWGLDKALDNLNLLLTFDKGEKAKKGIEIAKERLLEVREMIEENKLEDAEKAKEEHGNLLNKVKESVRELEKDNSTEEIKEVIEIEKELEEYKDDVEEVNTELKVTIKIKGVITDEQRALINSILDSFKGQTGEVEIEIKNKKDDTKIKIKQKTGKSDDEIEYEIEDLEEEKGLANIKREKALEEIEDAKENLEDLEEELRESNITNKAPITTLISNAKEKLSKAEEASKANDFGEAFGQANAARQLINNAEKILEKAIGKFEEEEELEIEVEIEEGIAEVTIEIGDDEQEFILDTTDKEVILSEIASKLGVTVEQIRDIVEFDVKEKSKEKVIEEKEAEEETEEDDMNREKDDEKEDKDKSGKGSKSDSDDKDGIE